MSSTSGGTKNELVKINEQSIEQVNGIGLNDRSSHAGKELKVSIDADSRSSNSTSSDVTELTHNSRCSNSDVVFDTDEGTLTERALLKHTSKNWRKSSATDLSNIEEPCDGELSPNTKRWGKVFDEERANAANLHRSATMPPRRWSNRVNLLGKISSTKTEENFRFTHETVLAQHPPVELV